MGGEHRPVALLGVGDQARVLLGAELGVLGGEPVAAQVTDRVAMQLQQLLDHAAPAGLADPRLTALPYSWLSPPKCSKHAYLSRARSAAGGSIFCR